MISFGCIWLYIKETKEYDMSMVMIVNDDDDVGGGDGK